MSTVWKTRQRLLQEQLEQWVERLSKREPSESVVVDELVVRLLTGVVTLLQQHEVSGDSAGFAAGRGGSSGCGDQGDSAPGSRQCTGP